MSNDFKQGDFVKQLYNCSGSIKGHVYQLKKVGSNFETIGINGDKTGGCTCYDNWIKVKQPKGFKKKIVNFILQYELDEDPIEEFETMVEVDNRIKQLVEDESSLQRDSIKVYEVKAVHNVKVETKITKTLIK